MGGPTWFVHIKETCRPYERRNRSPKQNWRGKYVFPQTARLVCKKEDGREKVTVKKDMDRKISTDRKNDKVILVIEDNENFAKYLKEIK